jgi:hypothetical protein
VAGVFCFENEHGEREKDQEDTCNIHRQQMHCVQCEHKADSTHHARGDHSGMRELRVEAEHADDQQKEKHVGRDDARKEFLAGGELELHANRVGKRQLHFSSVKTRDFAAVQVTEEIVFRIHDKIDHFPVEGLFLGEGLGVGDGGFRERGIATALFGEAAEKSSGVVGDFFSQGIVDRDRVSTDSNQRRGGSGMRAWSHCGDVGREQDEEAG